MAIKFLSNETIDGTLVITKGITTGSATGGNSGSVTIAGGITQSFQADGSTVTYGSHTNTATATSNTDASAFLISQKNTGGTAIEYRQGVIADGNAFFGKWQSGSITGIGLNVATGNVTFSGSLTGTTGTFTGLVSGITPTAAANFVTKEYIDGGGGAGSGFLPLTGGTLTGDLTIDNSSPEFYLTPDSAKYSWMIAAQENVDQHFEITPSTTVGGTTFNAPALKINGANSDATFAGNVLIGTNISSSIGLQVNHSLASGAAIAFFRNSSSSGGNGIVVDVTNTPNTYIADFRIGNVSKVRIDTLGSVGIGTTSPTQKLNVVNDNTGTWTAKFTNNTNNVYLSVNDANNYGIYVTGETKNYFSGNVGIGTTIPDAKLHVSGSTGITIENTSSTNVQLKLRSNGVDTWRIGQNLQVAGATALEFYDDVNNVDRMVITNSGLVGIGTTSPVFKLDIRTSTAGDRAVLGVNSATSGTNYGGQFNCSGVGATKNVGLYTTAEGATTNIAAIFDSGNVGIGTITPMANTIYNGTYNQGLNIDTGGHSSLLIGDGVNDGGMIQSSDDSQRIIITANVYDQPNASWSRFTADSAALIDVYGEGSAAFISFNVDSGTSGFPTNRMHIKNNGNVGIGNTVPYYKLDLAVLSSTSNTQGNIRMGVENGTAAGTGTSVGQGLIFAPLYGGYSKTSSGIKQTAEGNYFRSGLSFFTNNTTDSSTPMTEKMRLNMNGALSFGSSGTSYGSSGQVLTSNGNASPSWQAAGGSSSPWTSVNTNDIYFSGGKVGINNTSPASHQYGTNDLVIGDGSTDCGMTFYVGNGRRGEIRFDESTSGTASSRFSFKYDENGMDNNGVMTFKYNNAEMWRFGKQTTGSDMPKTLIKGNSSLSMSSSNNMNKGMVQISGESSGSGNYPPITMQHSSNGNSSTSMMVFKDTSSSSFGYIQRFVNNSNTSIGSIRFTSGQNGVSFDTSSDYRLKEDLKDFKALEVVSKVKVYDFKWKSDKSRSFGVMAHELKELIPQAVSGEKDALLEDGSIEVQGVDYSKVIPHLIQSIQELKAEIELLKKK